MRKSIGYETKWASFSISPQCPVLKRRQVLPTERVSHMDQKTRTIQILLRFLDIRKDDETIFFKKSYLCKRQWRVETSRLPYFQIIGSEKTVRLSALRAGRPPFTPRKIPGTHSS
jgi:hypothetical protein